MILTKSEILKEIKSGKLKITPFSTDHLGTASIELSVADTFRLFPSSKKKVRVDDDTDYKKLTKEITSKKGIILKPGELALAITRETVELPSHLCGWIEGRSRFARLGLGTHITASFIQPGSRNRPVLELTNNGKLDLVIVPGTRIAKLILEKTQGSATYRGKFHDQSL